MKRTFFLESPGERGVDVGGGRAVSAFAVGVPGACAQMPLPSSFPPPLPVGTPGKRLSSASSSGKPGVATVLHAPDAVLADLCGVRPSVKPSERFAEARSACVRAVWAITDEGREREVSMLGKEALLLPPNGDGDGRGDGREVGSNAGDEWEEAVVGSCEAPDGGDVGREGRASSGSGTAGHQSYGPTKVSSGTRA